MTEAPSTDTEEIVVYRRRSFAKVLFSPFGILALILTVVTFGVMMLILVCMYCAMPRWVWIRAGRLYADQKLPPQGVELGGIRLHLGSQVLLFFTINRYLRIYFPTAGGKEQFLNINQAVSVLGR